MALHVFDANGSRLHRFGDEVLRNIRYVDRWRQMQTADWQKNAEYISKTAKLGNPLANRIERKPNARDKIKPSEERAVR